MNDFEEIRKLQKTILTEQMPKTFFCKICEEHFSTPKEFEKHIRHDPIHKGYVEEFLET